VPVDIDDFGERLTELRPMDGVEPTLPLAGGGSGLFSGYRDKAPIGEALAQPIHEGGGERSRWGEFNKTAGKFMAWARAGEIDMATARDMTFGWMLAKMVPPWPERRFDAEWRGLLAREMRNHGVVRNPPASDNALPAAAPADPRYSVAAWAAGGWVPAEAPPPRRHLVQGVVMAGQPHLFAAAPGAGKTFLMLDLALKIAAHLAGEDTDWCGQKLTDHCVGKAVVFFTTEDGAEELRIRIHEIDPTGRRFRGRVFIIPTSEAGGAFPLVEYDPATRTPRMSRMWTHWFEQLRQIPDLGLVMIDTFSSTMHGNENDATIVNEYLREGNRICGELGAAFMVSHHIRKQGKDPIASLDDFAQAIRGSSGLLGGVRMALGTYEAPDWRQRLKAMNMDPKPKTLFMFGVVKANNPETLSGTKSLLRRANGLLVDVTERDPYSRERRGEMLAWLIAAVRLANSAGFPYKKTGSTGLFVHRDELPPLIRGRGKHGIEGLAQELLDRRMIVLAASGEKGRAWIDTPDGPSAAGGDWIRREGHWVDAPDWSLYYYDPVLDAVVGPGL
jgi:hypothetical protein